MAVKVISEHKFVIWLSD